MNWHRRSGDWPITTEPRLSFQFQGTGWSSSWRSFLAKAGIKAPPHSFRHWESKSIHWITSIQISGRNRWSCIFEMVYSIGRVEETLFWVRKSYCFASWSERVWKCWLIHLDLSMLKQERRDWEVKFLRSDLIWGYSMFSLRSFLFCNLPTPLMGSGILYWIEPRVRVCMKNALG